MPTRRIICLAASKKHLGFCYAGKDVDSGEWIRPVSARPGHEISAFEATTLQGSRGAVCDILDVPVLGPSPAGFQQENWLNDPSVRWGKVGTATYASVVALVDDEPDLWPNGPSSYNGLHDQVPEAVADELETSLKLIRVTDLCLLVHSEGGVVSPAKRVVRAKFTYKGETYWLKMTDPVLEAELRAGNDGEHHIGEAILCISLGETFNGYAYKLVASVITP